jgi:multicomponent K+:H+ antiporter subunit A
MRLPAELLVFACLIVGIVPAFTVGPILDTALRSFFSTLPEYSLAVWHGFTPELLMSTVALSGGVALYFLLHNYLRACNGPPLMRHVKGERIFERVLVTLSWRLARPLERVLGTRRLQPQVLWLIGAALLAGIAPFDARHLLEGELTQPGFDLAFALVWLVGMACALGAAVRAKFHRFAALVMLGGAGLVTCVSFVWLSAPDLALTQLAVETVTTVLLLLGLRWLPKRVEQIDTTPARKIRWYRGRDFALSVAAGSGLAALAYAVMSRPAPPESIARYFVENAYAEGGGTNIVNVILVDFRGFDTFGEITVVGVVALTVYALLRRFRPAPESIPVPEQQQAADGFDRKGDDASAAAMAVPAVIMTLLFPVIGAAALYLLLRGHDLPGGGFVAGITMAVGVIVQYMGRGANWVEARLRVRPVRWMGAGLLLAGGTGVAAWFFGRPFLTSAFSHVEIPLIGNVPLASALLFDVGVFALVVGATLLMLVAIAHQSVRSHRAVRATEMVPPRPPPES